MSEVVYGQGICVSLMSVTLARYRNAQPKRTQMRGREYGKKRRRLHRTIVVVFFLPPDPVFLDILVNLFEGPRHLIVALVDIASASRTALCRGPKPRRAVAGRKW